MKRAIRRTFFPTQHDSVISAARLIGPYTNSNHTSDSTSNPSRRPEHEREQRQGVARPFDCGDGGLLFVMVSARRGTIQQTRNGVEMGIEFIESYDSSGRQKKAPQASTFELSGKGAALMLIRCKGGYLQLVDGPEDDFWSGDPLSNRGERVGWINEHPVIMEPGQDGYYFDIDASPLNDSPFGFLLKERYMNICSSRGSPSSCRKFSMRNFDKAVAYVCKSRGF
jgi:hypothetical protein